MKAFEMFLNPGDRLLVEAPTYSGSLAFLRPSGANLVGIQTDEGGLVPADLDRILTNWNNGKKPKVLYTIPNGSNPTGGSLNEERRRLIYQIGASLLLLLLNIRPDIYKRYIKIPIKRNKIEICLFIMFLP